MQLTKHKKQTHRDRHNPYVHGNVMETRLTETEMYDSGYVVTSTTGPKVLSCRKCKRLATFELSRDKTYCPLCGSKFVVYHV